MANSLDRSDREAAKKKSAAAEERRRVKEEKKNDVQEKKTRKSTRSRNKKKSAARYDTRSMMKTMAVSVSILVAVFLLLEAILLIWKAMNFAPGDTSYTNNDNYWHLLNIADTCIGFLVGILAMDILNYFERGQKARRDEERAIIRHNRIVKPAIDMYLARKNSLITPAGEDFKPFQIVTNATPRDLKDLYGPSPINTDSKRMKIATFEYYTKKLNVAFMNMAEDINFDYNPEICDAVLAFINETTYGRSALDSIVAYGEEGNRTVRNSLIRQLKESSDNPDIFEAGDELNTALIVLHMIHAQEDALKKYLDAMEELDHSSQRRIKKL